MGKLTEFELETKNDGYVLADIEYEVYGSYRPATRVDPEEWPEVEVESIKARRQEDDTPVTLGSDDFTEKEWAKLETACLEDADANQYDPRWDGPEEDDR